MKMEEVILVKREHQLCFVPNGIGIGAILPNVGAGVWPVNTGYKKRTLEQNHPLYGGTWVADHIKRPSPKEGYTLAIQDENGKVISTSV